MRFKKRTKFHKNTFHIYYKWLAISVFIKTILIEILAHEKTLYLWNVLTRF